MRIKRGPFRHMYEGIQLKIESKKLRSGKCQVKFTTNGMAKGDFYGYMLVEASSTLREVVQIIKDRIGHVQDPCLYHQRDLFSVGREKKSPPDMYIYRKNAVEN